MWLLVYRSSVFLLWHNVVNVVLGCNESALLCSNCGFQRERVAKVVVDCTAQISQLSLILSIVFSSLSTFLPSDAAPLLGRVDFLIR
jgi:hypothetical protein